MRALVLAYLAVLALAALSWLAAQHDLGTAVALAIAAAKTLVIALVFMELRQGSPTDRAIGAVAALFVVLLCIGALADVALR